MKEQPAISQVAFEVLQQNLRAAEPSQVILFGSYARGEFAADSDLDLPVLMSSSGGCASVNIPTPIALTDRRVPKDVIVLRQSWVEKRHLPGTIAYPANQDRVLIHAA